MEYSIEAAEMIKTHKINAGLHLNLTEGFPVFKFEKNSTLISADTN
jgi:hypothetical protein